MGTKAKIVFVVVVFGLIFFLFFSPSQHWGDECFPECKLENQITDQDRELGAIFSENRFTSGRRGD